MYAQVIKWTVKPGTLERVYETVGSSLETVMRGWPGFRGYYDIMTSETTALVVLLYDQPPAPAILDERLERAKTAIADSVVSAEVLGRGEVMRLIQP